MRFVLTLLAFVSITMAAKPKDEPKTATIYIYRTGQFMAAGNNWSMFVDEKKVCKLSNNKYMQITVPAGKHSITAKVGGVQVLKKETEVEIDAEAGGTYYIACNVKSSITRTRLEMLEVTKSSAEKQMKEMKLDNCQETIDGDKE
jgi:formylmethanofuran dehydrogenase subunit D